MIKKILKKLLQFKIINFLWSKYLYKIYFFFFPRKPDFTGWGMISFTRVPWLGGGGEYVSKLFSTINEKLIQKIKNKSILLSQFGERHQLATIDQLRWRHYIVTWSVFYALKNTNNEKKNIVECGVCDGLTAFFACNVAESISSDNFNTYLYDSWEAIRKNDTTYSETNRVGAYEYLNLENTKKNLIDFKENTSYIVGYIPDSFELNNNPSNIDWLHLDLVLSKPTIDCLNFFFSKINKGGVILFNDYAKDGCIDIKNVIDEFAMTNSSLGILQHLPTGQAIFFKF